MCTKVTFVGVDEKILGRADEVTRLG